MLDPKNELELQDFKEEKKENKELKRKETRINVNNFFKKIDIKNDKKEK